MKSNHLSYHQSTTSTIKHLLCIVFVLLASLHLSATHNRAGEITYRQIGPLTIEVTVTTYTKTSSAAADRDSLEILWGDGTSLLVKRTGSGTPLANDVKKNEYTAEHTYPGRSTYTIAFQDPNRVGSILNVNYPNSIDVPFYLSTTFTLLNPQFQGYNSSAILLQPPIDIACVGQPFVHNPNAYDPDGDSLAYELVSPLMGPGQPVSGYKYPDEILSGIDNIAIIDAETGDFRWVSPPQLGEYNIAIKIKEYRKGVLINSIIRDMQIKIVNCNNRPPTIAAVKEICVIAGQLIELPISIDDPDLNQQVMLSTTGGPFVVPMDKGVIDSIDSYWDPKLTTTFRWQTTCNHVSKEYYQVVFRAVDNYFGDTTGLATFHTLRIKVVAPPPDSLEASADNGEITLTWESPYNCEFTNNNFFQGFSVWRKESPNPFVLDSCETGLESKNYQEIEFLTKLNDGQKYFYIDVNVEKAKTYCYRVQAEFSLLTPSGSLYNRVESLPSDEICEQVSRDLPLITKVSVTETQATNGIIHIRWAKPVIAQLDTQANPGPYKIEIYRTIANEDNYEIIPSSIIDFNDFGVEIDTNYFDNTLNTIANQYQYKIVFYTGASSSVPYGESSPATSIYATAEASDRRLTLDWQSNTPWTNYTYDIYKRDDLGNFTYLQSTGSPTFVDNGLTNQEEYCYYIEATGSYSLKDLEDPLINLSQIICARPIDNVPPCPPKIEVTNLCEDIESFGSFDEVFNTIRWNNPNTFCENKDPLKEYNIYYAASEEGPFELIGTRLVNDPLIYDHYATETGLAGCYAVTATDLLGNESELSEIVCKENCPLYDLPNTFTPNGDGANDLYRPMRNLFITRIDLKIFNEWGNLVFETADPAINWDGTKTTSGQDLNPGSYYYVCRVFTSASSGEDEITPTLKGYIQLVK